MGAALWLGAICAVSCGRDEGPQLREWRLPATDSYPVVGHVSAIAEGPGGEIWFATQKNGASRYASGLWRNLGKADGIPDDVLHSVLPARDGSVWFASSRGVVRWLRDEQGEREHFTSYTTGEVALLPSDDVRILYQRPSGDETIWFGTSTRGLASYHARDGWRGYVIDPQGRRGPRSGVIRAISGGPGGSLWIGSNDGIAVLRGGGGGGEAGALGDWSELRHDEPALRPDRLLGNEIRHIRYSQNDGSVWVATSYGLSRFDPQRGTFQSLPPIGVVNALLPEVDPSSNKPRIWIGSLQLNAIAFEPESGSWQHQTPGGEFSNLQVNAISRDRDGTLWFGTNQGLWTMSSPPSSSAPSPAPSPASPAPSPAAGAGAAGAGAAPVSEGERATVQTWRRVESEGTQPVVMSLLRTRGGELWVGTAAGLLACPGACERWNNPSNVQTLRRAAIYALLEASDGTIWIGSEAGVYSYDPRRSVLSAQNTPLKLPRRSAVYDIAQDASGTLWFATELGVPTLNPKTGERRGLGEPNTRRGGARRIVADPRGDLYLTSPERIVRLRRGARSSEQDLTAASQLTSVRSVAIAADGSVWFGGGNGLARYEPISDSFTTYFALNNMSSLAPESGMAWLGMGDGALRYRQGAATCQAASEGADRARDSCQRIPVSDAPVGQRSVTALSVASKDAIWLGTPSGIRRLRRDRLAGGAESSAAAGSYYPAPAIDNAPPSTAYAMSGGGSVSLGGLDRVLQRELTQVYRDHRGDLWLAFAQSGVVRLDSTGAWTAVTPDGAAPIGANINDIFEDRDGRLWFSSDERGVSIYDPSSSRWQWLTTREGLLDNKVYQVRQTSDGLMWLATAGGVNRITPDLREFSAFSLDALRLFVGPLRLAIHAKIQPCVLDGNSRILVQWIASSWQPLSLPIPNSQGEEITAIENDDQGALWLGTRRNGVFRFDEGGSWSRVELGAERSNEAGPAPAEKDATKLRGIGEIAKLNGLYQQSASGPETPSEPVVNILRDETGSLWVFTDDNDKPGGFRIYRQEDGDRLNLFTTFGPVYRGEQAFRPLGIDAGGVLWGAASTLGGARSGKSERRLVRAVMPSSAALPQIAHEVGAVTQIPGVPSKQIIVTPDALIQVRGTRQLVKYALEDGERPKGEPLVQEVPYGTTITDLAPGPAGRIWVATDTGGLLLRRVEREQAPGDLQLAEQLPAMSVTSLALARLADPRQPEGCTLWVATTGGVAYVSVCSLSGALLNKESWRVRRFDTDRGGCVLPPGPVDRLAVDRDPRGEAGRVVLAYNALDGSRFASEDKARLRRRTRFFYIDYDPDKDSASCQPMAAPAEEREPTGASVNGANDEALRRRSAELRRRSAVDRAQVQAMAYSSKHDVGLYAATSAGLLFSPDIERLPVGIAAGEGRLPPMPVSALAISPDRFSTVWLATTQQGDTPPYVLGYRPNSQWIYVLTQEQGVPLGSTIDGLGFTRDSQNPSLGILVVAVGNRLARGAAFVVDDGARSWQYRLLWLLSIIVVPLLIIGSTVILFTLRHPLVIKLRATPQALIDDLPLAAVPVALRRLSMARALPEVFTQLGLPRDRERLITLLAQGATGGALSAQHLRALAALLGMPKAAHAEVLTIAPGVLLLAARLKHPEKLAAHPTALVAISAAARQENERRVLFDPLREALAKIGHPEPHPFLLLTPRLPTSGAAVSSLPADQPYDLPLHLHLGEAELRTLLFAADPSRRLAGLLHARRLLTSSPYSHEGDVKSATMFVGRDALLRDLATAASPQAILVGPRRVGKTSLLKRLAQTLRLNRPEFDVHFLDLLGIKTYEDAAVALQVAMETARFASGAGASSGQFSVVARAALEGVPAESPEAVIIQLIRVRQQHTGRRVVLLIDEGDALVKTDAERDFPLLNALRALQAQDLCAVVMAGYLYLYRQALSQGSPLYNFARVLLLGPLEQSEAVELSTKPMSLLSVRYADSDLPLRIARDTGGYPSFVQLICDQMLSELKDDDLVLRDSHLRAAEDSQRVYDQLVTMLKMNTRRLTQILVYALLGQDRFTAAEAHKVLQQTLQRSVPFSVLEQALTELRVFSLLVATTGTSGEGAAVTTYGWGIPLLRSILRASEPEYALAGLLEELSDSDFTEPR
jgi:ligand-binding sensor domain-containing protein